MKVEYSSNNSGGNWWLDDADWFALEKAGWQVNWSRDKERFGKKEERWLGALATSASREGLSMQEAIDEWESVTGQSSDSEGCPCCGPPPSFSSYDDDGNWVDCN